MVPLIIIRFWCLSLFCSTWQQEKCGRNETGAIHIPASGRSLCCTNSLHCKSVSTGIHLIQQT